MIRFPGSKGRARAGPPVSWGLAKGWQTFTGRVHGEGAIRRLQPRGWHNSTCMPELPTLALLYSVRPLVSLRREAPTKAGAAAACVGGRVWRGGVRVWAGSASQATWRGGKGLGAPVLPAHSRQCETPHQPPYNEPPTLAFFLALALPSPAAALAALPRPCRRTSNRMRKVRGPLGMQTTGKCTKSRGTRPSTPTHVHPGQP